jgi:Tfp pilus assembly protein PilX
MNTLPKTQSSHRAHGVVLPVVLILLLVLSVASVAMITQISSQTRMAANAANEQVALQLAEATLRIATNELQINVFPEASFHANTNGLYCNMPNCGLLTTPPWTVASNWTSAQQPNPAPAVPTGYTTPSFIIEELPPVYPKGTSQTPSRPVQVYRITARALGLGNQSEVMLQTLYQKAT